MTGWLALPPTARASDSVLHGELDFRVQLHVGCNTLHLGSVAKSGSEFESCSIINFPGIQG